MNRMAVLIASPCTEGTRDYLPGTIRDIEKYREFLLSPLGGAWKPEEITTLRNPSATKVASKASALTGADYGFVLFSGHGCHRGKSTWVLLNPSEEIDADQLRIGAPRQTLIVDCCRKTVTEPLYEVLAKAHRMAPAYLHPGWCRTHYDMHIEKCGSYVAAMFACLRDETASETSEGGYYADALLNAARDWLNNSDVDTATASAIFSVADAHEEARAQVRRQSGNRQNPDMGYARSGPQFPFAVIS
jgi:hypothetical protein